MNQASVATTVNNVKEVVEAEQTEENNADNQPSGMSPVLIMSLFVIVAILAYLLGKHRENFITRFRKTFCLALMFIMFAYTTEPVFASSLNNLPTYAFGGNNAQTMHFDMSPTNGQSSPQNNNLQVGYFPPLYQEGNYIGKLIVEKLNKTVNIYEGESLASMNKGGGRFSFSGVNNGNTSIIGHNRGRSNGFFLFVKDLRENDVLTLEIGGVTKRYAVTHQYTVSDTDFSPFMEFGDNRLTLVTCVENQSNKRRIAVAHEI